MGQGPRATPVPPSAIVPPDHAWQCKNHERPKIMSGGETTAESPPGSLRRRASGRPLSAKLPIWVLGGAFLGILVGLAIGPRAAVFRPAGLAYSMMLESVIYPYILSSVIGGLGGLVRARAMRLFHASWIVYLFLWIADFAALFLLAGALPPAPPPNEISAGGGASHLSLLQALIPYNVTAALSRTLVPAIVVFALAFGVAIQTVAA